jgi:pimeloyl-ACP methyl ester carboxylesterase
VVIFQHGITQNRTNLFALADTLAAAGFAAIAIDLPLHGITDTASPFYNAPLERTFNVDLLNNETGAPGSDGVIDTSGAHFINLSSSLTTRDNVRQGVADLIHLTATLPTLDSDGDGLGDFATPARFVGHSLGGIVGTVFLGVETNVSAATLANPGGGLAKLVIGSETIGPRVIAGLRAAGLEPGTAEFESFLSAFQQVVDAADPINYGFAAATEHPVHMIEVLGDATVPNSVPGAPLSGTEPLARSMGLMATASSTVDDLGVRALVRFSAGDHASFLLPTASPAATLEMQGQMAGFMASDGTVLTITNPGVISPVP